jgi:hypothetical protein
MRLDHGPTRFCRTPSPRGPLRPFDRHVPGAPFREGDDQGSRPDRWSRPSLDSAARMALRLSSRAAPRCLEPTSTTDVSRHEHPRQTSPSETVRRAPWVNPPTFDFEAIPDIAAFPPSFGDGAGPPCGHPASNGHVLDGTPPASGWSTATFALARSGGGRAPQLYRLPATPSNRTL